MHLAHTAAGIGRSSRTGLTSASVLIPTLNPGPGIAGVLSAIFEQEGAPSFEVVVVDSGSTAEDLERVGAFPVRLMHIPRAEFGHGKTRNLLAREAQGDLLLFLSQDAQPASRHWMARLVAPLRDPRVAGAYARQVPHPGADPFISFFLETTYPPTPARRSAHTSTRVPLSAGRGQVRAAPGLAAGDAPEGASAIRQTAAVGLEGMFFSNVSSAIRRDAWEHIPFREDVVMSEDQHWAHDALRAGYEVVYEPEARVYHSHNYSLKELFRRNRLSGASLRGLIALPRDGLARQACYVAGEAQYVFRRPASRHLLPYMLLYEAVRAAGFSAGLTFGPPRRA
ncbi:MAG: glycosyltransferase [Chloroflexota bacterium]